MKRCKDCGVELTTADGVCKRILRCRECQDKQKSVKNKTDWISRSTRSHQTEYYKYSVFVKTLADDEIRALIKKWRMECYRGKGDEKLKAMTILKILAKEYALRAGDRIINITDTEGSVINESEFES
jgi:hypothetical protein